jgi:hypothetical protein
MSSAEKQSGTAEILTAVTESPGAHPYTIELLQAAQGTPAARRSRNRSKMSAETKEMRSRRVDGSGKIPLTSVNLQPRSLRRKSFLSSIEKSALTERRSMNKAFSLRA